MKHAAYIFFLTMSLVFAPAMVGHVQASVPPMEAGSMAEMMSAMSKRAETSHAMMLQGECADRQGCEDPSDLDSSGSTTPKTMCDVECQIACASGANLVAALLTHGVGQPEEMHLSYTVVHFGVLNGRTPAQQLQPPRI